MNKTLLVILLLSVSGFSESFLQQQRKSPRFISAETDKLEFIQDLFKLKGLSFPNIEVFIRIFKNDKKLELWSRTPKTGTFTLIRTYKICAISGTVGPKRKIGDGQVPEGCYYIDKFNPYSNFYLSLGLNYPNESDRIIGGNARLGGDIFIHGDCVTIGCIPLTDYYIKELYVICVYAKNNGQEKISVHLFPLQLNDMGMKLLKDNFKDPALINFWQNLQKIYNTFNETNCNVQYFINQKGEYILKE